MNLQNSCEFEPNKFQKPDILHAPIYIWVWNSVCTKELIDKQLLEMERFGVRAFYILPEPKEFRPETMPTYLSPDYMSEEFLDLYAYAIERGTAMGMTCWIYDEGGWPSGGACGMVLRDHPEYAKRALTSKEVSFAAQSAYKATAENFLAAFTENNEQIGEGYVFEKDTVVTEYYVGLFNFGGSDYPDLLNREATEYFLNVTHDKYASALGSLCGSVVTAVFTDEPKAPGNPMNADLLTRYEEEYGESVLPYLPLLAGKVPATEENAEILRRWYDLCSKEFCRNFLLPCKEWSNARGMVFTGHLDRDHDPLGCINGGGHFHLMRGLRCLDLPGIDIIWRQLYPNVWMKPCGEDNGYNGFFPRYASSAARQTGTEFAMTESLGVLGPGVPYEKMRYMLGYQAVRGINVFNFFNVPLGRKGNLLAQELPVFTEEQVYFDELSRFNSYVERLSYIASLGDRICDTALYYPVNDFWGKVNAEKIAKAYDALGRELEYRLIDFDIIDDDIIAESWKDGEDSLIAGRAVYRNIVIPENAYIPPKTAEILDKFVAAGGKVFRSADSLRSEVTAYGNSDGLRACRRNTESGELLLLFREDGENGEYRISVSSEKIYRLSLENGKIYRLSAENGVLKISLDIGETAVLLVGGKALEVEKKKDFSREFEIKTPFVFGKEKEQICSDKGFEAVLTSAELVKTVPGSWNELVGEDFSGSCVYGTEFELSKEYVGKCCELDLGKVSYTAKVELNGVDLGAVLASPYRFEVPANIIKEQNKLQITVVNTIANWYAHTDYFDRWEKNQLSPYFDGERNYAADYADGGLYGPVKICFE